VGRTASRAARGAPAPAPCAAVSRPRACVARASQPARAAAGPIAAGAPAPPAPVRRPRRRSASAAPAARATPVAAGVAARRTTARGA
jgi:hypothetical protein